MTEAADSRPGGASPICMLWKLSLWMTALVTAWASARDPDMQQNILSWT
uniref:Uncharacterized protein n=1 Tax=Anguilla anguilla TaxID=7936 RepID=A0A0E9U808_ANGAN